MMKILMRMYRWRRIVSMMKGFPEGYPVVIHRLRKEVNTLT